MLSDPRPGDPFAPPQIRCFRCRGTGRSACEPCGATGRVVSGTDQRGAPIHDRCTGCFGTRTRICTFCGGQGLISSR